LPSKQSKRMSGAAPADSAGMGIDLDLDDDLDALFAEALAATEERAARTAPQRSAPAAPKRVPPPVRKRQPPTIEDTLDDAEADASMHFMIDDVFDKGEAAKLDLDGYFDLDSGETDTVGDEGVESIDELESDLKAALHDDDEDDEDDLQTEMERLLAESFALPGDELPIIHDEEDDEEILAAGDDGIEVISRKADEELDRLRNQVAEMGRLLSIRDLELRTAEERVETLESQLVATARQNANIVREFESFRRRAERDRAEHQKFAGEKVIKEFLGVYDNLERALEHAGADRESPLGQGVAMILGQFLGALRRCDVEKIEASRGTEFDPTVHEAVGQEFNDEIPSGGILNLLQAGFSLNGRLVRAAVVNVSGGPKPKPVPVEPEAPAEDEDEERPAPKRKASTGGRKKKKTARSRATAARKAKTDSVEAPTEEVSTTDETADAAPDEPAVNAEPAKAKKKSSRSKKKKSPAASAAPETTDE
jgi:molecular chaperone GrpE